MSSPTPSDNRSWQRLKEEGKKHFQDGNYTGALVSFQQSLEKAEEVGAPSVDREILLSNSVASRLKIGGAEMACVAVEEAKKCIALNNRWAKAHIRLASAYIALGGHSNDACQALQNAIRLEPSNSTAKNMLMKELRNRDSAANNNNNVYTNGDDDHGGHDNDADNDGDESIHVQGDGNNNPTYVNEDEYTNNNARPSAPSMNEYDDDIDDSPTTTQRILNWWRTIQAWYQEDISDNWRSLLHIFVLILVLYVAFGGRFGLGESPFANRRSSNVGSSSSRQQCYDTASGGRECSNGYEDYGGRMGNYGEGNAYDDFYNNRRRTTNNYKNNNRQGSNYGSTGTYSSSNQRRQYDQYDRYDPYDQQYNDNDSYSQRQDRYGRRTTGGYGNYNHDSRDDYYYSSRNSRNRNRNYRRSSEYDDIYRNLILIAIVFGINKMLGVPMRPMGLGLGMGRFFGGRGIGVRFGGGGNGRIRFGGFGGFPMGVGFGGARGRFHRRGWY